jgi:cyclase
MSLAVRIIPVLLRRGNSLVKGVKFDAWRSVGHPLQAAKIHASRAVDELVYLDIGATPSTKGPDLKMAEALTDSSFIPVTIGGGVRSVDDVQALMNAGADKVLVCTHAVPVVLEASKRFGSQAIVAGIDVLGKRVALKCGAQSSFITPLAWASKLYRHGAGEILLQDVERDGVMRGYNLKLIEKISAAVNIPVIASCGAGSYQDMADALNAGASGVAAGSLFQFTDCTPQGAAEYLSKRGFNVRQKRD